LASATSQTRLKPVPHRRHRGGSRYDVFISYSHKDAAWVSRNLVPKLQEAGLRVYFDTKDFGPGEPIGPALAEAIERSSHTVAVMTPSYLKSKWGKFELRQSIKCGSTNPGRKIIPILREPCEPPPDLVRLSWVDLSGNLSSVQREWKKLLVALHAPQAAEPPQETGPEAWYVAEPFAAPSDFTGRSRQRKLLDEWLEADPRHPVLVVRALGGYGKSALAWYWLLHDVQRRRWPKVVWWSFTSPTATIREFLNRTLSDLSGGALAVARGARGPVFELLDLLRCSRTLLVLDGVEDVLRQVERDSQDPLGDRFLRGMSSLPGTSSKLLVLTRFRPRALEAEDGAPLAGCREECLGPLEPIEACNYLRRRGVVGTRLELERACKRYDFHPLSVSLLAGQVMADLEQPGDIAAARRLSVTSGDAVAASLQSLRTSVRALLRRVACFRGKVPYGPLAATAGKRRTFYRDLRELLDHGLLQRDGETGAFHLHPLVRQSVDRQMSAAQRQAVHLRIYEYLANFRVAARRRSIEDLRTLIELCHHAAQSRQYEKAYSVLHDHLFAPVHYRFGEYMLNVELLSALFPGEESVVPRLPREPGRTAWVRRMHLGTLYPRRLGRESPQAWVQTALALSLRASGQPRRALQLIEASRAIHTGIGDVEGLLVDLVNLSDLQWTVGGLRAAEESLREQIQRSRDAGQPLYETVGHQDLGLRLAFMGRWRAADDQFRQALDLSGRDRHRDAIIWAHRARKELMRARMTRLLPVSPAADLEAGRVLQDALDAAREAKRLLGHRLRERHFVRACWLLGAAYRARGDLAQAEPYLQRSLRQCRSINLLEFEAEILLELARTRQEQGRGDEARDLAGEGLLIAQRGPYVLTEADVQLFLAAIACDAGDLGAARGGAERARELARCDGPPYRYEVAYREAGALLRLVARKATLIDQRQG
jgi:tetratricopeptide (TPR) repeat protein